MKGSPQYIEEVAKAAKVWEMYWEMAEEIERAMRLIPPLPTQRVFYRGIKIPVEDAAALRESF